MAGGESLHRYVEFADPMAGQGRPLPLQRSRWLAALAWLGLCLLAGSLLAQELKQDQAQESPREVRQEDMLRLRLAWGGGESRAWHGKIRLSEGRILDFAPLGSAEENGGILASPKLDDFDVAYEVERLLRGRKWEQRNGPFSGFQSPPGRF